MAGPDLQVLWFFGGCMRKMLEQGKQPLTPGAWSSKFFSLPVSFSHAFTHGDTCPGEASSANSCPRATLWARAGHTGFRSSLRRLASWQRPLLAWKWGWAGVQVILGSRCLEHGQEGGPRLLVGVLKDSTDRKCPGEAERKRRGADWWVGRGRRGRGRVTASGRPVS